MAIYRVHLPVGADAASAAERARFQREGFSWPALLFGPVWLLARGIWRALTVWLAAALALGWAIHLGRLPSADGTWFVLLSAIYLGLEGNSLAAAALERRGYKLADIAGGANRLDAERSFFSRWTAEDISHSPAHAPAAPRSNSPIAPAHVIGMFPEAGG
jgi:Protein of unknown function (DUF2628)